MNTCVYKKICYCNVHEWKVDYVTGVKVVLGLQLGYKYK